MDQDNRIPTKDRILFAAVDLFADKGFKETSVREIARTVGIKASSLYKHYADKEAILARIFELFKDRMEQASYPKEARGVDFGTMEPQVYMDVAYEMFKQVMWNPITMKIAKIITAMQQSDHGVKQFFMRELIEKPNAAMQIVLEQMVACGAIDPIDTRAAAEEYNAYIIYLHFEQNFLKSSPSLDQIDKKMRMHNQFFSKYVLNKRKTT